MGTGTYEGETGNAFDIRRNSGSRRFGSLVLQGGGEEDPGGVLAGPSLDSPVTPAAGKQGVGSEALPLMQSSRPSYNQKCVVVVGSEL